MTCKGCSGLAAVAEAAEPYGTGIGSQTAATSDCSRAFSSRNYELP